MYDSPPDVRASSLIVVDTAEPARIVHCHRSPTIVIVLQHPTDPKHGNLRWPS